MSAITIVINDLADSRVEILVAHRRNEDPSRNSGQALALCRIALASLADIVDLRGIGEQFAAGKTRAADVLLPLDIDCAIEVSEPDYTANEVGGKGASA